MSLAEENVEVVRRGYEAFNTADMAALTELFDERSSWHTPGRSSVAGDHQGRDAVFAQFGRYAGETGGTFKAALQQLFAAEDGRVVGLHHNSGERNGIQLDTDCCIVFQIEDGRLVDGTEIFSDLYAWDAFWA
jgi:ketosteroid isomerase-like protein